MPRLRGIPLSTAATRLIYFYAALKVSLHVDKP